MQKLRQNSGGAVLLWIVAGALLIFTAARSLHLVTDTLPEEMRILGVAALFGLDIGLLAWLIWTTRSARGGAQRTIGMLMVVVCLVGITAAVIGDTLLVAGGEQYQGLVETVAVFVVPAVVLANVVSIVLAHLFDPSQDIRDAQRALSDELDWQLADHLRQNAAQVAAGVVPEAAAQRQAEMVAGFMAAHRPSANSNGNAGTPSQRALRELEFGVDGSAITADALNGAVKYVRGKPRKLWTADDEAIDALDRGGSTEQQEEALRRASVPKGKKRTS